MFVFMQSVAAIEQQFVDELLHLYHADEIRQFYQMLVEDRLGWSKTTFLLHRKEPLNTADTAWLMAALSDLLQAKPIQYILGYTWFMGMKLAVSEAVLIPRPETEELVHLILGHYRSVDAPLRIIDIGTGSGCIALALKEAMPQAQVYALDVSNDALRVARQNAANRSLQIDFIQADILEWELIFQNEQRFDIVVSNPPYITVAEQGDMHSNVLEYEPHLALFVADSTPLLFYEHIAAFAYQHLVPRGGLYFEINQQYGSRVQELLQKKGFDGAQLYRDLHGADRIVYAGK